jgi:hypothetical protein
VGWEDALDREVLDALAWVGMRAQQLRLSHSGYYADRAISDRGTMPSSLVEHGENVVLLRPPGVRPPRVPADRGTPAYRGWRVNHRRVELCQGTPVAAWTTYVGPR